MRIILSIILLLATAPLLAQTLERGNGPEPSTLDAHKCPEVACGNILRDLYEGLVAKDGKGNLIPGMAERWEVSDDGRAWTFHLRDKLKWSNGGKKISAVITSDIDQTLNVSAKGKTQNVTFKAGESKTIIF